MSDGPPVQMGGGGKWRAKARNLGEHAPEAHRNKSSSIKKPPGNLLSNDEELLYCLFFCGRALVSGIS